MTKARAGLNQLLALHPDADVAEITHQEHKNAVVSKAYKTMGMEPIPLGSGPWTSVALVEDDKYLEFAIWNRTGNVYTVDDYGAVADDPFIILTEVAGRDNLTDWPDRKSGE